MKFDLGETGYEKQDRLAKWHKWFAWHPVQVGEHDYRWMETVERCAIYHHGCFLRWGLRAL